MYQDDLLTRARALAQAASQIAENISQTANGFGHTNSEEPPSIPQLQGNDRTNEVELIETSSPKKPKKFKNKNIDPLRKFEQPLANKKSVFKKPIDPAAVLEEFNRDLKAKRDINEDKVHDMKEKALQRIIKFKEEEKKRQEQKLQFAMQAYRSDMISNNQSEMSGPKKSTKDPKFSRGVNGSGLKDSNRDELKTWGKMKPANVRAERLIALQVFELPFPHLSIRLLHTQTHTYTHTHRNIHIHIVHTYISTCNILYILHG